MADIVKRNNGSVTETSERNVFEQYSEAVGRNRIIGEMLKFQKGEWSAGRDSIPIETGTELIAAPHSLELGWIRWEGMKPTDFDMGKLIDGFRPAKRSELGDNDPLNWERDDRTGQPRDPWQLSNQMLLLDFEEQQIYTFPTSSKGGINALGKLMGIYGKRVRTHPSDLPVVALEIDSYKHPNRQYGKVFVPVFAVKGWTDRKPFDKALALTQQEEAAEDHEAEEQAARPRVSKPSPEKSYEEVKGGKPSQRARVKRSASVEEEGEDPPF